MSRVTKSDGLTEFEVWLIGQGRQQSTAVSYTATMRKVLRELQVEIGEAPTNMAWFDSLDETRPRSKYNVRSAWRAYAEWVATRFGVAMPMPGGSAHHRDPNASAAAPLPETVREAIRLLLKRGINYQMLHTTQWSDVQWDTDKRDLDGQTSLLLTNPLRPGTSTRVPLEALTTLAEYSGVTNDYSTPLLPLSPGSPHPYPIDRLRREVNLHKETPLEKAKRLRSTQAPGPVGSALGSSAPPTPAYSVKDVLALIEAGPAHVTPPPGHPGLAGQPVNVDPNDVDSDGDPDDVDAESEPDPVLEAALRATGLTVEELRRRLLVT